MANVVKRARAIRCMRCRKAIQATHTGRPRRFCSPPCRYAAYRKRKKQSVLFSSASDEWPTNPEDFAEWDREFGGFTLDVCATSENAKCQRYFTKREDGLAQPWTGRVWCNPPYGRTIGLWIRKAWESVQSGDAELVVCLVPSRTSAAWWHDWAMRGEIHHIRGRLRFGDLKWQAPFDSSLVVFRGAISATKEAS